ncbi:hypothetical protein [Psychrilyobacter atlanticus]|uniref:hypothetical protein n=1 Tax=Psychrilyobacter atlanticus TaxID=271091 RepID=UPI0003F83DB8|nr:hypothetical protein [Psychrilyobacter atlanticus]
MTNRNQEDLGELLSKIQKNEIKLNSNYKGMNLDLKGSVCSLKITYDFKFNVSDLEQILKNKALNN